jgi:hypothetical protein
VKEEEENERGGQAREGEERGEGEGQGLRGGKGEGARGEGGMEKVRGGIEGRCGEGR